MFDIQLSSLLGIFLKVFAFLDCSSNKNPLFNKWQVNCSFSYIWFDYLREHSGTLFVVPKESRFVLR